MRGAADTPMFKTPIKQARFSSRLLVIALLTLLLPPLGLVCLWRGARCPMRGKVLLSIVGVASMTVIFALMLGPAADITDDLPISYQYATSTAAPTVAPAPVVDNPVAGDVDGTDLDGENALGGGLEDGVIPANPAG